MAEISAEKPPRVEDLQKETDILLDVLAPEALRELFTHLKNANLDPIIVPAVWAIDTIKGKEILDRLMASPSVERMRHARTKAGKPVVNPLVNVVKTGGEEQVGLGVVFPRHGVTKEEKVVTMSEPEYHVVLREGMLVTVRGGDIRIGQAAHQQNSRSYLGVPVVGTEKIRFLGFDPPPLPIPADTATPNKIAGILFGKFNKTYIGEINPIKRPIDYEPLPEGITDARTRFRKP